MSLSHHNRTLWQRFYKLLQDSNQVLVDNSVTRRYRWLILIIDISQDKVDFEYLPKGECGLGIKIENESPDRFWFKIFFDLNGFNSVSYSGLIKILNTPNFLMRLQYWKKLFTISFNRSLLYNIIQNLDCSVSKTQWPMQLGTWARRHRQNLPLWFVMWLLSLLGNLLEVHQSLM